ARMRSFKAASSTLSPSWMSMARQAFPSRLELNRPEGSFNAAPLGNVILTTFLYVSPVQTRPPWDQTGVPLHFHSSTISGSAWCMISRTYASVLPRQSPSSLIFSSMNAEADSTGTGLFMFTSNSRSGARRRGLQAAPEEVREPPEHAGGRREAPRLPAIAHREGGDERRGEGDGEAGVGPLPGARRRQRKQQRYARERGPPRLPPAG